MKLVAVLVIVAATLLTAIARDLAHRELPPPWLIAAACVAVLAVLAFALITIRRQS